MKALAIATFAFISVLSTAGCNRGTPSLVERQQNAAVEGRSIADDLRTNHNIDLYPDGSEYISTETWNGAVARQLWVFSKASTRATIRKKLEAFIKRADRVIEIGGYETVRTKASTVRSWEEGRKNAQLYLNSLNEYEN